MNKNTRKHRRRRVRAKISGTASRPRASIYRSISFINVQLIDDESGNTLLALRSDSKGHPTVDNAFDLGKKVAETAKTKGIESVVYDRGGFRYHGRVKAVAEGLRAGGLQV